MRWTFGIAAALLLAAIGALWLRHERSSPSAAPSEPSPIASAPADTEPSVIVLRAEPASDPRAEPRAPSSLANEAPAPSLEQALAQRAYDGFGPRLVNYLVRQGLARIDAEPIVSELLGKTVTCALDAFREQAIEQRVDFDQVLAALEAELYDADGPSTSALVDVGAVDRRAMPCSMAAFSEAGIPPQAAADLFPRQSR
jgi:hypothetical protein